MLTLDLRSKRKPCLARECQRKRNDSDQIFHAQCLEGLVVVIVVVGWKHSLAFIADKYVRLSLPTSSINERKLEAATRSRVIN